MSVWRLLDTGPRTAAGNMALDAVLLDSISRGASPPTLRFMSCSPPAVLVGAFQRVEDEVREPYCSERGIDVGRRLTGGGAIYFDASQIGWEIVCRRDLVGASRPSPALYERLSLPVMEALRSLGIPAAFRPRNDIEVAGRKISGTGGTEQGDAILFQGTLLVDFDAGAMVRALRVPVEKLRRREIESLVDRVTWISREIGRTPLRADLHGRIARAFGDLFDAALEASGLTPAEERALGDAIGMYASDGWIRGRGKRSVEQVRSIHPTPGGMLRPVIRCDTRRTRIESVVLGGDFFAYPRRGVFDLEARLKGARACDVSGIVHAFFEGGGIEIPGAGPGHVTSAILEALERCDGSLGLSPAQASSVFAVGGRLLDVVRLPRTHLLLPYCAKPLDCEMRSRDGCERCGSCGVGAAYDMGEEAGLEVRTITSFEHLLDTLSDLGRSGATSFVGSCCEAFYVKHREDMESAGVPGMLVDLSGTETCYDLGKGGLAHDGDYEGRSEIDVDLLRAVIDVRSWGQAPRS